MREIYPCKKLVVEKGGGWCIFGSLLITFGIVIIATAVFLHQHTPLHIAAGKGFTRIAECLVKKGAEISMQDNDGVSTCLYF